MKSVLQIENLRKCSDGNNREWEALEWASQAWKTVVLGSILEKMGYKLINLAFIFKWVVIDTITSA